jgi:ABC-2 type transport system ATP-binding protein
MRRREMNVLEIADLHKRYRQKSALDGVSLCIEEGYVTGLVGPNGAGKTTLIKCVLNLVRADAGRVTVFGTDHRNDREVRQRVGFVHESSYMFDQLTATETGRIAALAYDKWESTTFAGYLDRFELPARAKIKTFSKGMKMRLALAVALSHRAELILMDEPSSGLDPIVRRELLAVIGEELARESRTFLISTHITSDLDRIADHVVVLDRGRVRLTVSRDELGDSYAVCRGGRDLLSGDTNGSLIGVQLNEFGFTALTRDRTRVKKMFGDRIVLERPTVEDLMVHTLKEE